MARQESYGLKEVADVRLFEIPEEGYLPIEIWHGGLSLLGNLKYSFDSLKVSNIELTSDQVYAKGGQKNANLVSWDNAKEATLTIEDALVSMDTLGLLLGGEVNGGTQGTHETVTVNANKFAGTYAIVGMTVLRSYDTGEDVPFYFYIPKGKISTSGTLTMSADGDPSTFEMSIKLLNGKIEKDKEGLIKFFKADEDEGALVTYMKGDRQTQTISSQTAAYSRFIEYKVLAPDKVEYELNFDNSKDYAFTYTADSDMPSGTRITIKVMGTVTTTVPTSDTTVSDTTVTTVTSVTIPENDTTNEYENAFINSEDDEIEQKIKNSENEIPNEQDNFDLSMLDNPLTVSISKPIPSMNNIYEIFNIYVD